MKKEKERPAGEAAPEAALPAAGETPAAPAEEEKARKPVAPAAPDEEKVREDVELFHTLFPEAGAKDVPKEVWEKVEAGQSLAASFALYTLMCERENERIRRVNEENAASAPPRIRSDGADGTFFSPEAVKKMTREEVRKNYKEILKSMDHWN